MNYGPGTRRLFHTTHSRNCYGSKHQFFVDCVWNVKAHAQKPDFVFRRNGRVHLNRRGRQFSRLLAAEVCASAVVTLDTPRSEVVWRVLATHFIRQFPLHFPFRASPCAITFQLDSTIASPHYLTTIASPHYLTIFQLDPRYAVGSRSVKSKMATDHLCKLLEPNALSALRRRSFPFKHVPKLKAVKCGSVRIISG